MIKEETNKNKKLLTLTGLMVIALLLGSLIGYTLSQSTTTFTITSGIYPSLQSFTIYKENTVCYAKNKYGYIQFSGTNVSAILIAVINVLDTWEYAYEGGNGKIVITAGQYDIDTTITTTTLMNIEGEGKYNTVLNWIGENSTNSKVFNVITNDVTLKNFQIDCKNKAGYGIFSNASVVKAGLLIENIYIIQYRNCGIYLQKQDRPYINKVICIIPQNVSAYSFRVIECYYPKLIECDAGVSTIAIYISYSHVPMIKGGSSAGQILIYRCSSGSLEGIDLESEEILDNTYAIRVGGIANESTPFTIISSVIANYRDSACGGLETYEGITVNVIGSWFLGDNIVTDVSAAGTSRVNLIGVHLEANSTNGLCQFIGYYDT